MLGLVGRLHSAHQADAPRSKAPMCTHNANAIDVNHVNGDEQSALTTNSMMIPRPYSEGQPEGLLLEMEVDPHDDDSRRGRPH